MDRQVFTVSEVNAAVRETIEGSFMPFWVAGEVGNLTIQKTSGHVYMTLKDASNQLRAVFFSGADSCRAMHLTEGMQVEAYGKLTVYPARGEYQLSIKSIQLCGQGDLQRRFEDLKRKLAAQGYFESARKKNIPALPVRIGLVTSPEGAALKDFLKIALARFPGLRIRIYPAPVQGKGAEIKLAAGIRFFNRAHNVDVIVLTRGGGSLEDLWAFNEEVLADAIFQSAIPVVSAVGHEIDFSIADFTADLRAPTPSGAAEMLIPQRSVIQNELDSLRRSLTASARLLCEADQRCLDALRNAPALRQTDRILQDRMQSVDLLLRDAQSALERSIIKEQNRLDAASGHLGMLSPFNVLKRGYALLMDDASAHPVTSAASVHPGDSLTAVLADGKLKVTVKQ